jgi:ABC-2 type transport system permease protein
MSLRPGSALWLLRHELRLTLGGRKSVGIRFVAIALALSVVLHAGAYVLFRALPADRLPIWTYYALGCVTWFVISFMLSQAILQSVSSLFDRGDLDLLLSSPLPTRSVFMVRSLGIALSVVALYLFLLAPVANVGVFFGHANLLAIYPTLLALTLAVTALGMWLTLTLVQLMGARRARIAAQLLGSLMGAAIFLLSQLPNLLGAGVSARVVSQLMLWSVPGGALASDSPVWLVSRALLGEPWPLGVMTILGLLGFWLVVHFAHERFLAGTQQTVTGSASRTLAAPRAGSTRFRGGLWRKVLFKEWRLILRDPQLIAQTLMQLLYLVPMLLLNLRAGNAQILLMPMVVFLASSLAGSIAWITVTAEDAPDLLGSAPIAPSLLRGFKLLAALLPVWLLVSPLVVYLSMDRPILALAFVFCLVGGTASTGLVELWHPRQEARKSMATRMKGHFVLGLMSFVVNAAWSGTAYFLVTAPQYAPLTLLLAVVVLAGIWRLGQSRRGDQWMSVVQAS